MRKLANGLTAIALFGVTLHGAPASEQAPTQPATAAAPDQQFLKADELDQLIAPIALYPDALLAEILMASTYPLEVVQADRWALENKNLAGDVLKAAADKQDWDNSLKSLVATPSVLVMMSTKLDWTQKLGAVLGQQPDVMDAVERLRESPGAEQAEDNQGADRHGQAGADQAGHRDRAGDAEHDLRAVLQSRCGLWRLALSGLSALLLSAAPLHRRRRDRDRPCLRCRLRCGALGGNY
jgi:Protein of unknown function (DUF3300)